MGRLEGVDLRLLRVFAAVVEGRGFTAAQTILNVGAPAISNQMTALESRLGVKLCHRGRAGFKLTGEGELVYGETQKLFAALEAFEFRVGAHRARMQTSLSLGIVDNTITDTSAPLHEAIGRFAAQAGDVLLCVECRPPNELLRAVMEGRLDLAIGSFPKILLNLTYRRLYDETHHFYCGASHSLFKLADSRITPDVLAKYPVISRGYWAHRDIQHFRSERACSSVNNMEAAARLILSGAYLGYLPVHYAQRWVASREMRAIGHPNLSYDAPFEVAYAEKALDRASARAFLREILITFDVAVEET